MHKKNCCGNYKNEGYNRQEKRTVAQKKEKTRQRGRGTICTAPRVCMYMCEHLSGPLLMLLSNKNM